MGAENLNPEMLSAYIITAQDEMAEAFPVLQKYLSYTKDLIPIFETTGILDDLVKFLPGSHYYPQEIEIQKYFSQSSVIHDPFVLSVLTSEPEGYTQDLLPDPLKVQLLERKYYKQYIFLPAKEVISFKEEKPSAASKALFQIESGDGSFYVNGQKKERVILLSDSEGYVEVPYFVGEEENQEVSISMGTYCATAISGGYCSGGPPDSPVSLSIKAVPNPN